MRPVDRWFYALAARVGLTPEDLLTMTAAEVLRRLSNPKGWS